MGDYKEKIKAIGSKVVIKQLEPLKVSKGGIIIPEVAKELPKTGVVISVGEGKKGEPMILKVGDIVFYPDYGGQEFTLNNTEYIFINQNEILATVVG